MRILIPVDGSDFGKAAVAFVASRGTLLRQPTEVALINVQYPAPLRAARAVGKEVVHSWHKAQADAVLKSSAAALKRAGAKESARYVVGTVADELAHIVANDHADLIVMGSHGHTGLKKLLFGSVASTVAASCTKPLLVLRGGPTPKRDSLKVAIALDGSKYGPAAARFVATHRDLFGAAPAVTLIHVVPDLTKLTVPGWPEREVATGIQPEQADAMRKAAVESTFAPVREILARANLKATEVGLVDHDAGAAIAAWATKNKPDLLVMGSLGFGNNRHSVLGSVATRVASRCRTALLLVREK